MNTKPLIVAALLLLISACSHYKLVEPGLVSETNIKFETLNRWSKANHKPGKRTQVMTRDGFILNRILIVDGLADGEPIFKTHNKDKPMPEFSSSTMPHELHEFISTSMDMAFSSKAQIKTSNIRPHQQGGHMGVQFDMEFYNIDGLLYQGKAVTLLADGKLYALILTAAKLHYYPLYEREFAHMANSFRL